MNCSTAPAETFAHKRLPRQTTSGQVGATLAALVLSEVEGPAHPHPRTSSCFLSHFLHILAGIKQSFFYEVSHSEKERIHRYFRQLGTGAYVKDFIGFETFDRNNDVLVRGSEVKVVKFISAGKPESRLEPRVGNVMVFTRGRAKPFLGTIWDASDAALLMTGLDSEPGAFDRFWTYEDIFGEPMSIRVSDIVLAEIDSAAVEEGLRQISADEEEGSEADDIPF